MCSLAALVAADEIAFAQAASTGGTLGKTEKSISGGEEQREPHATAPRRVHEHGRIEVTSATLGENCGVPVGNVTDKVGTICNGQETCTLPGSTVNNPDPALGCYKSFTAKWRCGQNSRIRSSSVPGVANETNVLTLSCN